jgi:hypothetical protein
MQEISFNTALIREMRSVAVRNRRVDEASCPAASAPSHLIEAEDIIRGFVASVGAERGLEVPVGCSRRPRAPIVVGGQF